MLILAHNTKEYIHFNVANRLNNSMIHDIVYKLEDTKCSVDFYYVYSAVIILSMSGNWITSKCFYHLNKGTLLRDRQNCSH